MSTNLNKKRISLVFLFVAFFGLFFVTSKANALTISPVRMEIAGDPGQTLSKEMILTNENKTAETIYSSFANFEAQGESGNPSFVEPKDDLGTWMSIVSNVTLKAGESKTIPFTITIPKNAEPGGHFATIFWGTAENKPGDIAIGAKAGLLVLLSVSGDVKENAGLLNFNTVNHQFFYPTLPVSFEYRFKNDGGDRIKPEGVITIRDTLFLPADNLDANSGGGNILPNSTRKFNVDWIKYARTKDYIAPAGFFKKFWSDVGYQWKNFAVGFYSARLNVAYGAEGLHAKKTAFFFVFPWQLVLVMLVIAFLVIWGGRKMIKRYNKSIIEKAQNGTE